MALGIPKVHWESIATIDSGNVVAFNANRHLV
jgi:hypothetical protein